MCTFLICTCFHCTDFPPLFDPCGLNSDVSSNPVRRPPAVYLSGGKEVQIESGNIAWLCTCRHPATGLLGLAWQTQSSPSPSLPPNPYGELLPSSSLRLLGSAAVLVYLRRRCLLAFPHDGFPSASTRATRSISGGDVLPMTASRPTASA